MVNKSCFIILFQICGHAFTVKSNLTNHQLRHGPLEYECQICGKRLAQPASLKKHLKSHAGNKPFQACNTIADHLLSLLNIVKYAYYFGCSAKQFGKL